MIDFEKELKAILEDDPLDLLKEKPKTSSVVSPDSRLKESFDAINQFIDEHGHEPTKSRDINERKLFSRLAGLRESPEKAATLLGLDRHNLLEGAESPEPFEVESVEDILEADPLGLLGDGGMEEVGLFDIDNLPTASRAATDFVAKRKPCKDFGRYEAQLIQVQREIRENKRRLLPYENKGEALVEGGYYILDGILLFLEKKETATYSKTVDGKRFREDGRTRCIFENGTESNMLSRSLAKALDKSGKTVTQTEDEINDEFQKNLGVVKEEDTLAGYIYVLKSQSKNAEIQNLQHLYKVGFSTTTVEKRISNAAKEPTYLMAPVSIVAEYYAYNMNTQKFESLIHRFFADVCLDVEVADHKGKMHQPREWFIAPLDAINRAIELIVSSQIQHYRYDAHNKEIVLL